MIDKTIKGIDRFQDWFGYLVAMLIYPMTVVVLFEVFMRYVFNRPTSWGFELTTFIYGIHFMLGLGYTFLHNGHVKVDVLVTLLKKRKQRIISLIAHLIMSLPVFLLFSWAAVKFAWTSIQGLEHSWSAWGPPIYPLKALMALGFITLFIQCVSSFLKTIQSMRQDED